MTAKANSFKGIASGTAITAVAQTGGTSGDQFDTLTLTGTGVGITVDTAADLTAAYDRGAIFNINSQASATAALSWTIPAVSTSYQRVYFKTGSANPNSSLRIVVGLFGTTRVWELRWLTTGNIALVDFTSGNTIMQSAALALNTIYRIEFKVALTEANCDIQVYAAEATTGALTVSRFGNNITGVNTTWNSVRFGAMSGSTAYTGSAIQLAAPAYSDVGFIGKAAVNPTFTVYNGTTEVPATLTVYNGTTEVPVTASEIV
jgi:hypothetical protein